MLKFLKSKSKKNTDDSFDKENETAEELIERIYFTKIRPVEESYYYNECYSEAPFERAAFNANPMVLLIGQYSTGKTTFIRYLLEQDFPGIHIGPEPTTDKFVVITKGEKDTVIPGNAVVSDPLSIFQGLDQFGQQFLDKFSVSKLNNPVLDRLTLIDTPGILAGSKQLSRGYDFAKIMSWFANRVDRIVMIFDVYKLDISDEMKLGIISVSANDHKINILLNKADLVTIQELMKVYGALLWSLSRVLTRPEVVKVFVGSFWDQPLKNDDQKEFFEFEKRDLFIDLQSLPRGFFIRIFNDVVKRARQVKIHAFIMSVAREYKQKAAVNKIEEILKKVVDKYHVLPQDIPKRALLIDFFNKQWKKCPSLNLNAMKQIDDDIKKEMLPLMHKWQSTQSKIEVTGGAFKSYATNPSDSQKEDSQSIGMESIVIVPSPSEVMETGDGSVSVASKTEN